MNEETAHPEQGWAVCRKWEALTVKGGVGKIDILLIQPLLSQGNGLANTINMKWIKKEPPTLFFNGILTNSQLFCAFIKVPLQPYSLWRGYTTLFVTLSFNLHSMNKVRFYIDFSYQLCYKNSTIICCGLKWEIANFKFTYD